MKVGNLISVSVYIFFGYNQGTIKKFVFSKYKSALKIQLLIYYYFDI